VENARIPSATATAEPPDEPPGTLLVCYGFFTVPIAGFDEKDSTSVDTEAPDYTQNLNDSIQGLTIGLPKEFFAEGLDDGVAKASVRERR
jgi:hypothetical protein